jgi:hypothetical protein
MSPLKRLFTVRVGVEFVVYAEDKETAEKVAIDYVGESSSGSHIAYASPLRKGWRLPFGWEETATPLGGEDRTIAEILEKEG